MAAVLAAYFVALFAALTLTVGAVALLPRP
jgi:hypothetical protein